MQSIELGRMEETVEEISQIANDDVVVMVVGQSNKGKLLY